MFPHCCSTKLITNQLLKHIQRWWSVLECMWTFQDKRLRCPWQLGYDPWKIPNLPNIPHIEYLTWPRCPNERCASSHLQSVGTNRYLLGQHRFKLSLKGRLWRTWMIANGIQGTMILTSDPASIAIFAQRQFLWKECGATVALSILFLLLMHFI